MAKRQLVSGVIAAAAVAALASAVWATQGSGATGVVAARAAFVDLVDLKFSLRDNHRGRDNIQVRNAGDTVMQQITFVPGGYSGWHSHPGPAVVLVASGQLTFYDGDDESCTGRTYSAGQALIDPGQGHVHFAVNQGQTPTVVWVTYFDVPSATGSIGVRDDAPAPGNCPF
jgi:quercetin dioxygenase-like cupin family protein